MTEQTETVNLHGTTDAKVWAEEFCKRWTTALCQVPGREGVETEEDFQDIMLGWFANAIMAGVDSVRADTLPASPSRDEIADKILDILDEKVFVEYEYHYPSVSGKTDAVVAITDAILSLSPASPAHTDDEAVDRFAAAMKAKLADARTKGRGGWDDPEQCSVEFLASLLIGHVGKGNPGNFEDIANLCMMLHQRGADPSVLASPAPVWRDMDSAPTHENWAVTVYADGVSILTIESNCLSGRNHSEMDEATIRKAASHLLGFLGMPLPAAPGSQATEQPPQADVQGVLEKMAPAIMACHDAFVDEDYKEAWHQFRQMMKPFSENPYDVFQEAQAIALRALAGEERNA